MCAWCAAWPAMPRAAQAPVRCTGCSELWRTGQLQQWGTQEEPSCRSCAWIFLFYSQFGDRCCELPFYTLGWRTPGLLWCLGRVDGCCELQQSQDITPALLHSLGDPVWFYFSLPEVVLAVKSFRAWFSRAPSFTVSPSPFTLTVQALLSRFYFQLLQRPVTKMPLWQLLPSPAWVILPKVEVWHKQGKGCALHLTCMSIFPGKPGRGSLSRDIPAEELLSESAPSAPGQLQPSRAPCAVMALCHSALPGDSKSHHCCSPTTASRGALTTTYPSLPPLLPDPCWKPLGKRFPAEPPVLLEGRCLLSTCSSLPF